MYQNYKSRNDCFNIITTTFVTMYAITHLATFIITYLHIECAKRVETHCHTRSNSIIWTTITWCSRNIQSIIVVISAKTCLVCTSMYIEIYIFSNIMHAQELCKFKWDQYSKKEDSNRLKLYTTLFAYSWEIRNSLFHFCSPNVT